MRFERNKAVGGSRVSRVIATKRAAARAFVSGALSLALAFTLAVSPALATYPQLNSQVTESYNPTVSGFTGDPYRILVGATAYTAPSSFWSGLGSNYVSSGSNSVGTFDVVFEDHGSTVAGSETEPLVSSMEFDMGMKKHLGIVSMGPVCEGQTVWDGTWVYAFRLCPWSERSVSSAGNLRVAFAWKGCFGTYFDDWTYTFNARNDSASLSPEKRLEPGDTVELRYYGGYNVAQTSRGTMYGIDFDDMSTCIDTTGVGIGGANSGTPTSTVITNVGDPRDASYRPSATVDDEGYVTFQGSNSIWYGGNYTVVKVADGNGFTAFPIENQGFTGSAVKPAVVVKDYETGTVLTQGIDYTVEYSDNEKPGTATASVIGMGAYSGSSDLTFTILPDDISSATVDAPNQVYESGKVFAIAGVSSKGRSLVEGVDYTIEYRHNFTPGTAEYTITGINDCTGCISGTFLITGDGPNDIDTDSVTIQSIVDQVFTGFALQPVPVVKNGDVVLIQGSDYVVSYEDNIDAGIGSILVIGQGSYAGFKRFSFDIAAMPLTTATIDPLETLPFTGSAIEPAVSVENGNIQLVAGTDYTVSYSNNTNAGTGTATATVTYMGNYSGTASAAFSIAPKALARIGGGNIAAITYSGTALQPDLMLRDQTVYLVPGRDYTVTYENNTNAGTALAYATCIGNYSGSAVSAFTILPADIDAAVVTAADQVYTGEAIDPVSLTYDGNTVVKGVDYSVVYDDNVHAGTVTATITGKRNFTGERVATFEIAPKNIGDASVTVDTVGKQVYTGEEIRPTPTVYDGQTVLEPETDYTISYSDNTDEGTGTITITGIGDYTGMKTVGFEIDNEPVVTEVAGNNRFATAAQAALETYPKGAQGVIVATGYSFPDALTASSLAGLLGYPILLSGQDTLGPEAEGAIQTLGADKVIIVGGTGAISDGVEKELESLVGSTNVTRLAGEDRYTTAAAIYDYGSTYGGWSSTAVIATGSNYPDALSISAFAAKTHAPIFLTGFDGSLSSSDQAKLAAFDKAVIVGGTGVIPSATETWLKNAMGAADVVRLAGDNRYSTSLAIAEWCVDNGFLGWNGAAFSTGVNFPDALAGGVLQGSSGSVLLLADAGDSVGMVCLPVIAENASAIDEVRYFGGEAVTTPALRQAVQVALGW